MMAEFGRKKTIVIINYPRFFLDTSACKKSSKVAEMFNSKIQDGDFQRGAANLHCLGFLAIYDRSDDISELVETTSTADRHF